MKKYQVECNYTFKGVFTIEADSKEEALEIQKRDTSATLDRIQASTDSVAWDFNPHPVRVTAKIKHTPKVGRLIAPPRTECMVLNMEYLQYTNTRATIHNMDGKIVKTFLKKSQKEKLDRVGLDDVDLGSLVEQLRKQVISQ